MKLLRLQGPDGVCGRLGHRPTTVYGMIQAGTLPPAIKVGRSSCWPDHEIDAVVGAIIAQFGVNTRGRQLEDISP